MVSCSNKLTIMTKSIIYIASLTHSGSTLLDLMLGGHSRFIGLGEVARFLERGVEDAHQATCSCGHAMDDCRFWSQIASRLSAQDPQSFENQYASVFETFTDVFGQDHIPVDSSKHLPPLELLHTKLKFDVQVLYLIKDVRSFTISQLDDMKRKGKGQGRNRLQRSPFRIFWQWYADNKAMQRFLIEHQIPFFQLGYEELCLYPEMMAQKICGFLGEESEPAMLMLTDSNSHVMRGNRMRNQREKSAIRYDHRWFLRSEWILPALLFPHIMRYNAKEVYRNQTEAIWKQ
jgi:hypothetical protein